MKIFVLFMTLLFMEHASGYIIIVNKKNQTQSLSASHLKDIFLGENLRWEDNIPIHIVDYNSNSLLRKSFTEEVIGVSISRVYKTWIRLSLAGNSTPPKILRTEEEVVDFVSNDPFAIGYIDKNLNFNSKEVKAIKVEN
ncbi:MAG: hypothetical protein PHY93_08890 [Bacteriovorax sp.]|nr:hypothetical protein [Bacteriovorax sp.]